MVDWVCIMYNLKRLWEYFRYYGLFLLLTEPYFTNALLNNPLCMCISVPRHACLYIAMYK